MLYGSVRCRRLLNIFTWTSGTPPVHVTTCYLNEQAPLRKSSSLCCIVVIELVVGRQQPEEERTTVNPAVNSEFDSALFYVKCYEKSALEVRAELGQHFQRYTRGCTV
jgi:hypothetical protein